MASIRPASHAGSWYEAKPTGLRTQVSNWLAQAVRSEPSKGRFAVGPHAGYRFCGSVLAHTYASLDSSVERVVIMGPSHFKYFRGLRTTQFAEFASPLGSLKVDEHTVRRLRAAGVEALDEAADVKEHSWEMHVPFLQHVNPTAKIVPLLFGASSSAREQVGDAVFELLLQFVADPKTAFVVSSDFCHWGSYFDYQPFVDKAPLIYKAIEALDREGMAVASTGSSAAWREYISTTGNTICGEKPLGLLLQLCETHGSPIAFKWLAYSQSSSARSRSDSSVSYAAGVSV